MRVFNKLVESDKLVESEIEEEQNQPLTLLEHIDRVVRIHSYMRRHCEDTDKKTKYQEILDKYLTVCAGILEINTTQVLIFSFILNESMSGIEDLANLLQVTRIQCFQYFDDLDVLLRKRLIRKSNRDSGWKCDYYIPFEVIESLRKGKPFIPRYYDLSRGELFNHFEQLFEMIQRHEISTENFYVDFFNLLNNNTQLEFVKILLKYSLSEENIILLSWLCASFQQFDSSSIHASLSYRHSINSTASYRHRIHFKNNFYISEITLVFRNIFNDKELRFDQLLNQKLIEYAGDDFNDKTKIILTQKTLTELLGITESKEVKFDIMKYEDIKSKELFYNEKECKLVEQLTELLFENNYKNVVERLQTKKMRTGFSCLFFGSPGTGKTETALQIARISGRDIMPIDISMIKSDWFGESEKIIKGIFEQYRHRVEEARRMNIPVPILFFNEVESVINKRKDTSISGIAQTENTIQNIILEELDKLDGIVIATTNLTENIDIDFDRRFIYKIEFKKPGTKIRQSIWKSLIPELTEADTLILAEAFELSGGRIEYNARRRTIMGIMTENAPDFLELFSSCSRESILKNEVKVGY